MDEHCEALEIEQLKLMYAAIYSALGICPEPPKLHNFSDTISDEASFRQSVNTTNSTNPTSPSAATGHASTSSPLPDLDFGESFHGRRPQSMAKVYNSFKLPHMDFNSMPVIEDSESLPYPTRSGAPPSIVSSSSSMTRSSGYNEEFFVPKLKAVDTKVPMSKKLPPLDRLIKSAKKCLKNVDRSTAVAKYRWLCRESSDRLLLRYIRQCKGKLEKATVNLLKTVVFQIEKAKAERDLKRGEVFYMTTEDDKGYIRQFEMCKAYISGYDNQRRPVVTVRCSKHNPRAQSKASMRRFAHMIFELGYMCQNPRCDGVTIIFDLTGLKWSNIDNSLVNYIIKNFNTAYPNVIAQLFIFRAPKFFEPVWKVFKPWIDDDLYNKVKFSYSTSDLLAMISIDQLPDFLGGSSRYHYKWTPPRDDDDAPLRDFRTRHKLLSLRSSQYDTLEKLTVDWIQEPDFRESLRLFTDRQLCLDDLAISYWQLDPYVRSRSVFDRHGILGELREELAKGGAAQPVCVIARPEISKPHAPTRPRRPSERLSGIPIRVVDDVPPPIPPKDFHRLHISRNLVGKV